MRVSSVRAIMEGARVEGSADAFLLAREETGRAWPSYVMGASIVSFLGFVAAIMLSGVLETVGLGARVAEFAFALMVVVAVLERTTQLAQSGHVAPTSIFSILAGGVAYVLLTRATVRHVQKTKPVREFHRVSVDA